MNQLKDYIIVVPNIVSDELCDSIISEYKNCDDWINATTKSGESLDVRNCQTIGMSFDNIIQKNAVARKQIDNSLFAVSAQMLKKYRDGVQTIPKNAYFASKDTGYDLLKYEKGGFYVEHLDFSVDSPRAISCSFALNDGYEGGEFAFFDRELVYRLKKGSCIMFPSNFMYPHEIMPVTSGTRYSIVTWFV